MKNGQNKQINTKGFTLIELLVVVLIIGILAAIALPQYKKATEKAKAAQALTLLRSFYQSAQGYLLLNGQWPYFVKDLDLETPNSALNGWSVNIQNDQASGNRGFNLNLNVVQNQGPYKGAGFVIYHDRDTFYKYTINMEQILCVEYTKSVFKRNPGDYCQKIIGGTHLSHADGNYFFQMP